MRAAEAAGVAGENVAAYVFALSAIGLVFTLYLAWASLFQLQALCLLCAVTYVAVVGLFVVSWRATSVPMTTLPRSCCPRFGGAREEPGRARRHRVAPGGRGGSWWRRSRTKRAARTGAERRPRKTAPAYPPLTPEQRAQFEAWYNVQPVVEVPIDKGTAKVLIVKFNDFSARRAVRPTTSTRASWRSTRPGGTVKYVVKHFPLEMECNTLNAGHDAACEAAAAVLMATKKGTAEKLEAWLFANQGPPHLTPNQVRKAAADVGGITDFDAQYPAVLNEVKADAALGARLGVKSTPTFFINGRRIAGGLPPAGFEAAIELELEDDERRRTGASSGQA